jgi:hypothetical protein
MQQGQPRLAGLASIALDKTLNSLPVEIDLQRSAERSCYSSRINTAAAMVVVHSPRLSPTADCVTLLVRTILLEIR